MKIYTLFCFLAAVIGTSKTQDINSEQEKENERRRLSQASQQGGPCLYFNQTDKCGDAPGLNPSGEKYKKTDNGLSVFAHEWMEHTCCKILNEPLAGVISSVWLWLQVCTKAMNTANSNPQKYKNDDEAYAAEYIRTNKALPYNTGPLYSMQQYCPQDLNGGELSEWVVASFFPVMKSNNANFKQEGDFFQDCDSVTSNGGAVTVLLTEPEYVGRFGHLAMVLHTDDAKLGLPDDDDNKQYVSFSNYGNTIGAIITGTQATHVGFGRDLQNVTKTVTLYNADVPKMVEKWDEIKSGGVMFDLLEKNCAYTVLEVLSAGYPECKMNFKQLWTPVQAFGKISEMAVKVQTDTVTAATSISHKDIQARHIYPPDPSGVSAGVVVAIALACFFGTLLLAILVAVIIIMKIKADAAQQLDRNLANLLISAASTKEGPPEAVATKKSVAKKNSVVPSNLGDTIQHTLETTDTDDDGKTDKNEFMQWAKDHNLKPKQAKLMWTELDRDNNNQVDRSEWEKYIEKRPNLKWLATRLQSVARH